MILTHVAHFPRWRFLSLALALTITKLSVLLGKILKPTMNATDGMVDRNITKGTTFVGCGRAGWYPYISVASLRSIGTKVESINRAQCLK